jgi:YHS domain-containing protein
MKLKLFIVLSAVVLSLGFSQYVSAADESRIATQEDIKSLPNVGNKVCPVSGEKISAPGEAGAMGEAIKYEYNGKIYNLCCPMCVKDFKKNPEKYSKVAEDEAAKDKEANPAK